MGIFSDRRVIKVNIIEPFPLTLNVSVNFPHQRNHRFWQQNYDTRNKETNDNKQMTKDSLYALHLWIHLSRIPNKLICPLSAFVTISFLSVLLFVVARAVMRASLGSYADSSTECFLFTFEWKSSLEKTESKRSFWHNSWVARDVIVF